MLKYFKDYRELENRVKALEAFVVEYCQKTTVFSYKDNPDPKSEALSNNVREFPYDILHDPYLGLN